MDFASLIAHWNGQKSRLRVIIMVYKSFDYKLFEENDPIARRKAICFLESRGCKVEENIDKYGIDLLASKNGKKCYVEIERRGKKNWYCGDLLYPTLHVPSRKEKYLGKKFAYLVMSYKMDRIAWLAPSKVKLFFITNDIIEVPNCYVPNGEKFFDIPKEEWEFYEFDGNIATLLNN